MAGTAFRTVLFCREIAKEGQRRVVLKTGVLGKILD